MCKYERENLREKSDCKDSVKLTTLQSPSDTGTFPTLNFHAGWPSREGLMTNRGRTQCERAASVGGGMWSRSGRGQDVLNCKRLQKTIRFKQGITQHPNEIAVT